MTDPTDSETEERPFIRRIGNNLRKSVGRLKRNPETTSEVPEDPAQVPSTLDKLKRNRSPIEDTDSCDNLQIKRAQNVEQPFLRRVEDRLRKSARRLRRTLGMPVSSDTETSNNGKGAKSARNRRRTRVFGCIRRDTADKEEQETYEMPKLERPRRDPLELRKERVDAIYAKYGARRIPGPASKATPAEETLQELNIRTEKLETTERVTDDLQVGAQSFSTTAQQLAERYRNEESGKWYEFWKI